MFGALQVSSTDSILTGFWSQQLWGLIFLALERCWAVGAWCEAGIPRSWDILPEDFICLFLERGEGKEKERERNINGWLSLVCPLLGTWPATQACVLTGNQTGNPLVHRPMFNSLSYTSQGSLLNFYPPHMDGLLAHSMSPPLLPVWMDVVSLNP